MKLKGRITIVISMSVKLWRYLVLENKYSLKGWHKPVRFLRLGGGNRIWSSRSFSGPKKKKKKLEKENICAWSKLTSTVIKSFYWKLKLKFRKPLSFTKEEMFSLYEYLLIVWLLSKLKLYPCAGLLGERPELRKCVRREFCVFLNWLQWCNAKTGSLPLLEQTLIEGFFFTLFISGGLIGESGWPTGTLGAQQTEYK